MLSRLQQIALMQETYEGVGIDHASLFVGGNASFLAQDPDINFDFARIDRKLKSPSLTPAAGLSGKETGTMTFGLELTGGGSSISTIPQFDLPLRACGFRREVLMRYTISAVTGGPIRHGTRMSQAVSTAVATVVGDVYDGDTYFWCTVENGLGTGTPNASGTWTVVGGSATISVSARQVNAALGYWPVSQPITVLTLDSAGLQNNLSIGDLIYGVTSKAYGLIYEDYTSGASVTAIRNLRQTGQFAEGETVKRVSDDAEVGVLEADPVVWDKQLVCPTVSAGMTKNGVRESIKGARGNVKFNCVVGEQVIMDFEFKGAYNDHDDGVNIAASGITYAQAIPPLCKGLGMTIGTGTDATLFSPNMTNLTLDMGNNVQLRESFNAASGIFAAEIVSRSPSGSMNPEALPEGVHAWIGNWKDNQTERIKWNVGTTDGNLFQFQVASFSSKNVKTGDRNGRMTREIEFDLTTGTSTGQPVTDQDNEIVIIWQNVP